MVHIHSQEGAVIFLALNDDLSPIMDGPLSVECVVGAESPVPGVCCRMFAMVVLFSIWMESALRVSGISLTLLCLCVFHVCRVVYCKGAEFSYSCLNHGSCIVARLITSGAK